MSCQPEWQGSRNSTAKILVKILLLFVQEESTLFPELRTERLAKIKGKLHTNATTVELKLPPASLAATSRGRVYFARIPARFGLPVPSSVSSGNDEGTVKASCAGCFPVWCA